MNLWTFGSSDPWTFGLMDRDCWLEVVTWYDFTMDFRLIKPIQYYYWQTIVPAYKLLYLYHLHTVFHTTESVCIYRPAYQHCVVPIPAYKIAFQPQPVRSEWLFTCILINLVYLPGSNCTSNLFYKYIHKHPTFAVLNTNMHIQWSLPSQSGSWWQLRWYILAAFSGGQVVTSGLMKDCQVLMFHWGVCMWCYNVMTQRTKPSHFNSLI